MEVMCQLADNRVILLRFRPQLTVITMQRLRTDSTTRDSIQIIFRTVKSATISEETKSEIVASEEATNHL